MSELHSYCTVINNIVARKDGRALAAQLSLPVGKLNMSKKFKQLIDRASSISPTSYCASNILDHALAPVVGYRVAALVAIDGGDWATAYQSEANSYNAILEAFKEENSYWIIPALTKVMNDLRELAIQVKSFYVRNLIIC